LSRNIQKLGVLKRDKERQRLLTEQQKLAAWHCFWKSRKVIHRVGASIIWSCWEFWLRNDGNSEITVFYMMPEKFRKNKS
jgi:hypothetical protein